MVLILVDDSDLIDELTTKMATDNMKRNIMQNSKSPIIDNTKASSNKGAYNN